MPGCEGHSRKENKFCARTSRTPDVTIIIVEVEAGSQVQCTACHLFESVPSSRTNALYFAMQHHRKAHACDAVGYLVS